MAIPAALRRMHHRTDRRGRVRLLRWLLAPVAVLVLLGTGGWLLFGTSAAGLRQISVTGGHLLSPAQVRAAAAVRLGTPLARIDLAAVRSRVRTLPAVRDAAVRRQWPSTLVIAVTERTAAATVAGTGRYLVLDPAGVVFETLPRRPAGLPLVRLGHPGPRDAATRAAMTVLASLTPQLRAALAVLVADSPTRVRLELTGGRTVVWGDATDSAAKAQVATAFLSRSGRVIDVSAPEFVTVS
jgi:cell division protein FtsQ